ncbi:MAG: hypothetical protein WDO73_34200 [Ignavibacteriota bacterium]
MRAPQPLFVQADFGLDANFEPQLVEIQGFPSLYAYQPVMAECYRDAYGLDSTLTTLPTASNSKGITACCAGRLSVTTTRRTSSCWRSIRSIRRRAATSW